MSEQCYFGGFSGDSGGSFELKMKHPMPLLLLGLILIIHGLLRLLCLFVFTVSVDAY